MNPLTKHWFSTVSKEDMRAALGRVTDPDQPLDPWALPVPEFWRAGAEKAREDALSLRLAQAAGKPEPAPGYYDDWIDLYERAAARWEEAAETLERVQ